MLKLVVDADVQVVAEFMQSNVAASRLVAIADGLAAIAPLIWGRYEPEKVLALRLVSPELTDCAERRHPSASE